MLFCQIDSVVVRRMLRIARISKHDLKERRLKDICAVIAIHWQGQLNVFLTLNWDDEKRRFYRSTPTTIRLLLIQVFTPRT